MKIELDNSADTNNKINAYARDQVTIANKTYSSSLLLSLDTVISDWPPQHFSELETSHIEQILTLSPEIVLLGTGSSLIFPSEQLLQPLTGRSIGIEIMDTGAACRSYNFLTGEGRHVVAALLMIKN
jgi:uncharacterized protein